MASETEQAGRQRWLQLGVAVIAGFLIKGKLGRAPPRASRSSAKTAPRRILISDAAQQPRQPAGAYSSGCRFDCDDVLTHPNALTRRVHEQQVRTAELDHVNPDSREGAAVQVIAPPEPEMQTLRGMQLLAAMLGALALQRSFRIVNADWSHSHVGSADNWALVGAVLLLVVAVLEGAAQLCRVVHLTLSVTAQQAAAAQSQAAPAPVSGVVLDQAAPRDAGAAGARARAFEAAAAKVGQEDVPLVMAAGQPEPFKASLQVMPYSADDISGIWIKDKERSDSMDAACDAAQLHGLLRRAIGLMKGLEIECTSTLFRFSVISAIPILKITERYHFDGSITRFGRRDMRRGGAMGRAEPTPEGMVCVSRWNEPLPGWGKELFELKNDELHVDAHMEINGRIVKYVTIYSRR